MILSSFWVLFFCSAAFASIIGAYFGTADYRVRHDKPLITRTCYCPACGHSLAALHQIPVISWFLLKGRCHYCHEPVSIRYPLTEAGFLLFYTTSFCMLWGHPFLTPVCWFGFVSLLLLCRCKGHFSSAGKALAIFAGYHGVYGLAFFCVYAATHPM